MYEDLLRSVSLLRSPRPAPFHSILPIVSIARASSPTSTHPIARTHMYVCFLYMYTYMHGLRNDIGALDYRPLIKTRVRTRERKIAGLLCSFQLRSARDFSMPRLLCRNQTAKERRMHALPLSRSLPSLVMSQNCNNI